MTTATLVLHGYWRSSCTWRVRIALAYKGVDYESVPVHLLREGGEQHASEHRRLNPMAQVPVLVVNGTPLAQSMALLEYLEEVYPTPPLLPRDPLVRARARQIAETINSGIQPLQNIGVMRRLQSDFHADAAAAQAWSRTWIAHGLTAVEALVTAYGGGCCVGDEVTFADLCLVPQLFNARRFSVDVTPFPNLLRVESGLSSHPAFEAAHPSRQPDAENL